MKNRFSLFLFAFVALTIINAQEKKYQSLLWEISGNNLDKKSYIYGSMHVSDKVSYHLSDAFYQHLLSADMVANESDPATWHDLMHLYDFGNPNYFSNGFYKKFYQMPVDKSQLPGVFQINNFMMNNLLFRTNDFRNEYQEETYLDMFIYQTGRKFNKKNVGLEDAFESMKLIASVDYQNIKPDLEKQQKLTKLLNGKSFDEVMKDFYREKNLDMLDSLMVLSSPPAIMEAMLYKRNYIMVKSIDSLVKKGSLFAAVGAAHIPGKKGIVELLREKGYTVNPIFSDYTEKGKNQKKLIEQTFVKPKYTDFKSSDQIITARLFDNVQVSNKSISSPDLSNGSFIQIKRLPLHNYLLEKSKRFNHKTLDSLFYENIQGEIISKKFIENKLYAKYDIKNKTKSGDFQRHQFYITPLEIISISLIGKLNFVEIYEDQIFDYFKINLDEKSSSIVQPSLATFSLNMPPLNTIYGDDEFKKDEQLIEVYGYDVINDSYFVCLENTLVDFNYIENTAYELNRIQDEYLIEVDALESKKTLSSNENYLISEAKIKKQNSYIKSILDGNKYYLLLAINTNQNKAFEYFDTFKKQPLNIEETYKTYKDSSSLFTLDVPYKHNQHLFLQESTKTRPLKVSKETNYFVNQNETFWLKSKSSEKVLLEVNKFHKYFSVKQIDTLIANYKKQWVQDSLKTNELNDVLDDDAMLEDVSINEAGEVIEDVLETNGGFSNHYSAINIGKIKSTWDDLLGFKKEKSSKNIIENEKTYFDDVKKAHVYEGIVTKSGSSQGVKFKYYIKDGITYDLKAIIDKKQNKNNFFDKIDKNVMPFDTVFEKSMYENKFDEFLQDANSSHDSIRYSALNSINYLNIEPQDLNRVKLFINTFEFKNNEKFAISQLLEKISNIKGDETISFFKNIYKENTDNANIQFAVLEALGHQKQEKSYIALEELLDYDLPISDNQYMIDKLFSNFSKDYKNSHVLVPQIFKYYSIKDYHDAIFSFVSELNNHKMISKKHLKKYRDMLLANAKLEYKRVLAWQISQQENNYDNTKTFDVTEDLIKHIKLLYPFHDYSEVKVFLNKSKQLNIKEILITLAEIETQKNNKISPDLKELLIENPQTLFTTYLMLSKNEKEQINSTPTQLIESVITIIDDVNHEKEDMDFLFEKTKTYGSKSIVFYFYKLTKKDLDESNYDYDNEPKLLSIGFVLDNNNDPIFDAFYSGLQKSIADEDKINELADEVIDESLNQNRPRATFGKSEMMNGFGFDEMMY